MMMLLYDCVTFMSIYFERVDFNSMMIYLTINPNLIDLIDLITTFIIPFQHLLMVSYCVYAHVYLNLLNPLHFNYL